MIGAMVATTLISLALLYFIYGMTIGVSYSTHKDMVRTSTRQYGYGTFEDFKREFAKRKWIYRSLWRDSLFGSDDSYDCGNKLHASIIEFDGKGMMIKNSIEYLKVRIYIAEAVRIAKNRDLVDWSDNSQNMEVDKINPQKKIE
jgi:hypothetical protein